MLNFVFSPKNPDPEKLSTYECGFEAFNDSRMEFDVRFYLVAILFIIFDLGNSILISLGNFFRNYWMVWFYINDDIFIYSYNWIYL